MEKAFGGKGGEREEKGEDFMGDKALGGKGGKGSQQGEGEKHLRKEKGDDLGGGGGGGGRRP